jgi:hypothetical protein
VTSGENAHFSDFDVLLDKEASISIFQNKDLLTGVRGADRRVLLGGIQRGASGGKAGDEVVVEVAKIICLAMVIRTISFAALHCSEPEAVVSGVLDVSMKVLQEKDMAGTRFLTEKFDVRYFSDSCFMCVEIVSTPL